MYNGLYMDREATFITETFDPWLVMSRIKNIADTSLLQLNRVLNTVHFHIPCW